MKKKNNKKTKLRSKFRFSVFNDTSHEEIFVFRANGLVTLLSLALAIIFLIGSVTFLISFTPLRELIPGYPNAQTRRAIVQNALKADSLEQAIKIWDLHLTNIQRIVSGEEPVDIDQIRNAISIPDSNIISETPIFLSKEDSLLREEVLRQEQLSSTTTSSKTEILESLLFFTPVKGVISNGFNAAINHPYLDIAAPENSPVSSILDGTVIFATWTEESGHTIQIQHSNDLISIYKHNSKLLKKTGDRVKAGTVIALVGNTGRLTSGAHLHFELWHKGVPVDPTKYIKF